ncbi:MAG: single-stranded-DNA-specific exonuclease RecJ [Opitutaceae bacterium]|jgi:single-stranded-DNA-specific exonuclease|nr:single-stranded-DNA-specific exonuclease RecJ [Opitutaceae bacterium]
MRWTYKPFPPGQAAALARAAGVSPILAELLLRAGLDDPARAAKFLHPALKELDDPLRIRNLAAAADRLRAAIAARETIVVLGDYDVDGVTSTALLVSILRRFGLHPRFIVPRRMEDGYGLSRSAIDRALEPGKPDLFIALDCGTNSHDEIAYLRAQNIDVIVVDHHRSKEKVIEHAILINPHVHHPADAAPPDPAADAWRDLCTVGLVFKLAHGLLKQLRAENHPTAYEIKLRDSLDLVALGTVADLVPLHGENRILARHGLRILQHTRRPGIRALMHIAGVRPENGLMPVDISFRLGPRINASGRIDDASLSVELMLSDDDTFCGETALRLHGLNRERQDIERRITEEAERLIEENYAADPGIVLYGENWHPGVVGIVAGRLSRKYHRPCIVLGNEGEQAKGSGRSVDGVNLVEALGTCCEHLLSWGGHPMAIGVSLPQRHIAAFRARFVESIRRHTGGGLNGPALDLAIWITPPEIGEHLMADICALHPFGQGNTEPVFGIRRVTLQQRPEIFRGQHFRFHFDDGTGRRLFGVAWKLATRIPPTGTPIDMAVEITWNHYNDRKLLQLELIDWRESTEEENK